MIPESWPLKRLSASNRGATIRRPGRTADRDGDTGKDGGPRGVVSPQATAGNRPLDTKRARRSQTDEGTDRGTGDAKWTGTAVDLVFGSNSQLRAIAEVYPSGDAAGKFAATSWPCGARS
jgi:hypothetical protein